MPVDFKISDGHLHTRVQQVNWDWDRHRARLREAGTSGAAPNPPLEHIYAPPDLPDTEE